MTNSYIRFLNVVDALARINPGRSLDHLEILLLEYILREAANGKTLLVGDLISLAQYGSQATLHGRVKNLVALGYINLVSDKTDARKKSVAPTKLAQKYAQFMSDCLVKGFRA